MTDLMAEATGIKETPDSAMMIYATFPSKESAERIARKLLDERKVVCANIFPPQQAWYYWDGELENEQEFSVIFKTRCQAFTDIEKIIVDHHPNETPCVLGWDVSNAHLPYVEWLKEWVTA